MSLERERRAIGFEKEDDKRRKEKAAKQAGIALPVVGLNLTGGPMQSLGGVVQEVKKAVVETVAPVKQQEKSTKAPSLAFLGVSMLGNLVSS